VGEGQDLWFVLAQAGGPNGVANLNTVRILTRGANAQSAHMVDLRELLDSGNRTPRVLRPGDLVFIDSKGIGTWGLLSTVLSTTLDALNIVLVARVLQDQNN
jgi:protein involved in polysaccharide export with SLBB domain